MRGSVAMIAAMVMFITNDTFMKLATTHMPIGEVISLRSLLAVVLLLVLLAVTGDIRQIRHAFGRKVALRSSLDGLTTLAYVTALAMLPISTTTTIYMATPLITTALAVPLLGEHVGLNRWCAILVGFVGAVIVTHPSPDAFNLAVLLPLVAALFGSLRDIGTRGISIAIPATVVSASSAIFVTVSGFALYGFETWVWPDVTTMMYMIGSALAYAIGTLLMVQAFRTAPIQVVSPLRYVVVPLSLICGLLVFGYSPDIWASIGAVLVVGAGLYSIHQETMKGRTKARTLKKDAGKTPAVSCGASLAGSIARTPDR